MRSLVLYPAIVCSRAFNIWCDCHSQLAPTVRVIPCWDDCPYRTNSHYQCHFIRACLHVVSRERILHNRWYLLSIYAVNSNLESPFHSLRHQVSGFYKAIFLIVSLYHLISVKAERKRQTFFHCDAFIWKPKNTHSISFRFFLHVHIHFLSLQYQKSHVMISLFKITKKQKCHILALCLCFKMSPHEQPFARKLVLR